MGAEDERGKNIQCETDDLVFFLVLGDTENQLKLAVLFAIPFPSSCDLCSRTRANSSAQATQTHEW